MAIEFNVWLKNVESIVEAFSDEEFQRMAWSGALLTSFNSPDEMVSVFFDDAMVPDFLSEYAESLESSTVTLGCTLSELLESYSWPTVDGFIDWKELLAQDSWPNIQRTARSFLTALKAEGDTTKFS